MWRLRRKTAIATAVDVIAVGDDMSGAMVDASTGDATNAVGCLLQMAGELLYAAARLLSDGEHYAGCALLRQVTEIEYLTWAIKEKHRQVAAWSREFPRASKAVAARRHRISWHLHDWGQQDPITS